MVKRVSELKLYSKLSEGDVSVRIHPLFVVPGVFFGVFLALWAGSVTAGAAEDALAAATVAENEIVRQLEESRALGQAGLWPQALLAVEELSDQLPEDTPATLRAELALQRAAFLQVLERTEDAVALLLPALEFARTTDQPDLERRVLLNLSSAYGRAGMFEAGLESARAGLALAEAAGDVVYQQRFLLNLGRLYFGQGDYERRERAVAQAAAVPRDEAIPDLDSALLMAQVSVGRSKQQPDQVIDLARAAVAAAADNVYLHAYALEVLGSALCESGPNQADEAIVAFRSAMAGFEQADTPWDSSRTALALANCLASVDRYAEALEAALVSRSELVKAQERRRSEAVAALEARNRTQRLSAELSRIELDNQTLAASEATARLDRLRVLNMLWAGLALVFVLAARVLWLSGRRRAQSRLLDQRKALLARTSHEIRNPAQGLVGLLDSLESGLPPGSAQKLRPARAAAHLIEVLARHYLHVAKRGGDDLTDIRAEACHLPRLLEDILALGQAMPSPEKQTLTLFVDPDLPEWIETDQARLVQILLNLIGNARRYAGQASIGLAARTSNAGRLDIRVEDNGRGFDPAELPRLYEPGFRGGVNAGDGFGSGLGLYVVREIVHAMGGTLTASNRPEGGAMMSIDLPLVRADPAAVEVPPAEIRGVLKGLPVLLIDDDGLARSGMAAQLKYLGCQVSDAHDIDDPARFLGPQAPQVVLIDGHLAYRSGADVCQQIRRFDQDKGWRRRIYLVSGSSQSKIERAHHGDWDGSALKPVSLTSLLALLSEHRAEPTTPLDHDSAERTPILDLGTLERLALLSGENGSLDQRLVSEYLAIAEERSAELSKAVKTGQTDNIAQLAHRWRGSAVMLGLCALSQLLELIESEPQAACQHACELAALSRVSVEALAGYLDSVTGMRKMD